MIDTTRIKEIREDNDISQIEMARILKVNRSTYSMWEIGLSIMPLDILWLFAKTFDLDINYILGITNERRKNTIAEFKYEIIGENIRFLRNQKNFSQIDLAKKLNVTQACIVRWEKALTKITIPNAYKLTKIFSISMTELCKQKTKLKIPV